MFLLNTRKISYLLFEIVLTKFAIAMLLYTQELQKISTLLQKNSFSTYFIDHHIAKFFNQTYQRYQTINSTETSKPKLLFIRLPYVHLMSNQIRKEINSFFQKLSINAKLILIDETFNADQFFAH